MKKTGSAPEKGDVVRPGFAPQGGHELSGLRPALVLSPAEYSGNRGMILCCPVTTEVQGYPFQVAIEGNTKVRGVIPADQVKSLDLQLRKVEKKGNVSKADLEEVAEKIRAILEG